MPPRSTGCSSSNPPHALRGYAEPLPMTQRLLSVPRLAISPDVDEVASDIEWRVSDAPVAYDEALRFMEERAAAIRAGSARECVWLLEHPPLFTAGTSADPAEIT